MPSRNMKPITTIVLTIVTGLVGCQSNAARLGHPFANRTSATAPRSIHPGSGDTKQDAQSEISTASVVPASMARQVEGADGKYRLTTAEAVMMASASEPPVGMGKTVERLPLPGAGVPASPSATAEPVQHPLDQRAAIDLKHQFDDQAAGQIVPTKNRFPEPSVRFNELPTQFWDLSLMEAVRLGISDQIVLRSLSGEVVRNPAAVVSSLDPAIQGANANFGIDAALAQFDPVVSSSASYAKNDDYFNNPSTTGNAAEVQQDLTRTSVGVNKVNQYGTLFSLGQTTIHDSNNNPTVFFPNSWDSSVEATVRQPLLQGRGRAFNRIAGPNAQPGFLGTSGIEISLIDNQIEYARFERGLREYVLELVNQYWQLDLAYRNYVVIRSARDASYEIWKAAKARFEGGLPGGEADREAQARSQYYQFEQQLNQALNAVQAERSPGVLQAEANLRRLMNQPQAGERLIRPADEPSYILPYFEWESVASSALGRREELRQQRRRVQRANLLVVAAKNFTLPRLDALATYRLSGLGDDLIGSGGKFSGALNELWATNYEEFEFGVNYEMPIGQRRALAGLRNARLQAVREVSLLEEMEQQIMYELGSAYREVQQADRNIQLAELRYQAARDTFMARKAAYEADAVGFEDLLEAQRFYLDAELAFHEAKTSRERAIYLLASESGTLLNEFQIRAR